MIGEQGECDVMNPLPLPSCPHHYLNLYIFKMGFLSKDLEEDDDRPLLFRFVVLHKR